MPTAKFHQSRPLLSAAIAKATLDLLHDHDRLVRCQPLVGETQNLNHVPDSVPAPDTEKTPDHIWYQQTEYIPILPFGIWKKKVIFYNWFKKLFPSSPVTTSPDLDAVTPPSSEFNEGGVESICYAPSDIKIYAVFRVEKRRPDFKNGTIASREKAGINTPNNTGGEGQGIDAGVHSDDIGDGDDGQGWRIVEETEMACPNWLILQFSERQHKAAHEKMLDTIVHEAMKRAYVPSSAPEPVSVSVSAATSKGVTLGSESESVPVST